MGIYVCDGHVDPWFAWPPFSVASLTRARAGRVGTAGGARCRGRESCIPKCLSMDSFPVLYTAFPCISPTYISHLALLDA